MESLTLFLPGLLGPLPEGLPVSDPPQADTMGSLLEAAIRRPVTRQRPLWRLAAHFGVETEPPAPPGSPPIAALSYLADFGSLPGQACFRCDPVHLQVDIAQALLFDSRSFEISAEETEQLTTAFNRHFSEDRLRLVFRDPRRWFLLADNPRPLHTPALDEIAGKNAGAFLPEELNARYWNRILNETQMLFFGHSVNLEREARGEPTVNGVWIYGGGAPAGGQAACNDAYSDDAFCKGLALHTGVTARRWADVFATDFGQTGGRVLLFNNALRDALLTADLDRWLSLLADWEARLFVPLWRQWRAGNIAQVVIDPDDGYEYTVTAGRGLRSLFRTLLRSLPGKRSGRFTAFINKNQTVKKPRP